MSKVHTVYVGELVWDIFDDDSVLGDAPANIAYHPTRLGRPTLLVTRAARDELGNKARSTLAGKGAKTGGTRIDARLPTGEAREAQEPGRRFSPRRWNR